jgi:hypothetical protein
MVMAHLLRLHRHWNPVQQTARPGFRSGQLPVVAKVGMTVADLSQAAAELG